MIPIHIHKCDVISLSPQYGRRVD